jgi:glucan 1,3-beta-glucosidase
MQNNKYRKHTRLLKTVSSLLLMATITACGGGKGSNEITVPIDVAPPEQPIELTRPVSGQESYSMLHQEQTHWVNEEQQSVSLRGINLGNWLSIETWMFGGNESLGEGIVDQCTLEEKLVERFGAEEKENILTVFRDSWLTEKDWDNLAEAGFNLVRLPFFFDLLEDDVNPKTLKEGAWHYLDWAIAQAKQREIYVILDLHGAAGRQGWEHHTGCEGKNELWGSAENIDRTKWLWGQIARRYKDENAIAAYGLLNEPWGTDSETLKDVSYELYDAVRAEDNAHIIVLPGHNIDGISAYGDPTQQSLSNVAFEMHFYPGIFGWGDINYETHRDWLTCGADGKGGVCEWQARLAALETPFLIGETQTWIGLGDIGGEVTRASFDIYNDINWAVTSWSFKTVSPSGGMGGGTWGYITNTGEQLLTKADTWSCNNWESEFKDACAGKANSVIPNSSDTTKTMYLVIKTGSFNGTDVVYDEVKLTKDATGENVIQNSDFGANTSWTELGVWGDPRYYDYTYQAGEFAGSETGQALRVTADAGHNSFIYQAVTIEPNSSYTLSGKFKDLGEGGSDMWSEIYLVPEQPLQEQDVTGRSLPEVNINNSSLEDIKVFFGAFADMDYIVNPDVKDSLTKEEGAVLFSDVPAKPESFAINVEQQNVNLTWLAPESNVTEYHVYRSENQDQGFDIVATTTETSYSDIIDNKLYFYYVLAVSATDTGYPSTILASGELSNDIPGLVEAETYSSAHPDVRIEPTDDVNGGSNVGHFEPGYWVEYKLEVNESGTFKADFRLASAVGDVQFEVLINNELIDIVTVPNTGGWQTYQTVTIDIPLEQGPSVLRLNSVDNQWNINWIDFYMAETVAPVFTVAQAGVGGATATITTVFDNEKQLDVLSLLALEAGNTDNNYINFTFDTIDFSSFSLLSFELKDTVGANTTLVTLVDSTGATWSSWTSDESSHNEWQTLSLNFTEASSVIDLTQVVEVRLAQWNEGEYFIADIVLAK